MSFRSCQETLEDKFSTIMRKSVRVGGPYLSTQGRRRSRRSPPPPRLSRRGPRACSNYSGAKEITAIEFIDCIISIPIIIEFNESKAIFEQNIESSTVSTKEVFNFINMNT